MQPAGGVALSLRGVRRVFDNRLVVIEGMDLEIAAGEFVAILGPSGGGKSTLTALLFRFYVPEQGSVLIDGRDAHEFDLTALRGQMALVPQDVLLFGGSIAENIRYGNPGESMEEIQEAAR